MIHIDDPKNCSGCAACAQKCPKSCIRMTPDQEGFAYPVVDTNLCINCDLCVKVCPILHEGAKRNPIKAYAMRSRDESVVKRSSSGGVFYTLASHVIASGGAVFGAVFAADMSVYHKSTRDLSGLHDMMGSKYVQSDVRDTYVEVLLLLNQGVEVMYTGTGCQISGLLHYLGRSYPNLLTVEVACHGVPSPSVLHKFLSQKYGDDVCEVNFRQKDNGWENYNVEFTDSQGRKTIERARRNLYMQAFLSDLTLRPSCYDCKFKDLSSGCDILLADLWGVENIDKTFADDKGVSLCAVATENGALWLSRVNDEVMASEINFDAAACYNPCLISSVAPHRRRSYFFKRLNKTNDICRLIAKSFQESVTTKIKNRLRSLYRRLFR